MWSSTAPFYSDCTYVCVFGGDLRLSEYLFILQSKKCRSAPTPDGSERLGRLGLLLVNPSLHITVIMHSALTPLHLAAPSASKIKEKNSKRDASA